MSQELNLYTRAFEDPEYSNHFYDCFRYEYAIRSLEEYCVDTHILDVGSGRGNLIRALKAAEFDFIRVDTLDLKKFYNVSDVNENPIHFNVNLHDKKQTDAFFLNYRCDVVICLDVLEHLEEHAINNLLNWASLRAKIVIAVIATNKERWRNHDLHLTVRDINWWRDKFKEFFELEEEVIRHYGTSYAVTLFKK